MTRLPRRATPLRQTRSGAARPALALLAALALSACAPGTAKDPDPAMPFSVEPSLFDPERPDTLGLPPAPDAETFTVYRPEENSYQYNHGAVLAAFQGRLYVQWQSSAQDEDAPETEVRYAISNTGEHWSDPIVLAEPRPDAVVTNGGWWTDGDTLVAYLNVWPKALEPRGGHVEYVTSQDGQHWSEPKRVTTASGNALNGIIEQDVRRLDDNRLLTAVHVQPGLVAKPYHTDDPLGLSGWTQGEMPNLEHKPEMSRELEPSWFVREDGAVIMTFRDQAGSFRVLASVSHDRGVTWSQPVITGLYDSRSKQSAGNLPDGTAFIVNNPSGSKTRTPLAITTSEGGQTFDRAYRVRAGGSNLQPQRFSGRYKRAGYSYPKSYVRDDYLYITYATNKEDIELTRIPVSALERR